MKPQPLDQLVGDALFGAEGKADQIQRIAFDGGDGCAILRVVPRGEQRGGINEQTNAALQCETMRPLDLAGRGGEDENWLADQRPIARSRSVLVGDADEVRIGARPP